MRREDLSVLLIMPWCPVDDTYKVGEINIVPFDRDNPQERITDQVKTILAMYNDLEGKPIRKAALVHYKDQPLIAELDEDKIETAFDYIKLVCFSGLAKREYFNQIGFYCNADNFVLYSQRLKSNKADFIGITTRRREGQSIDGRHSNETNISIPAHISTIRKISLDVELITALVNFRDSVQNSEWLRWQNAISCFNQANTDNEVIRPQIEWVLLCGAFEKILGAKSNAKDVAEKFENTIKPNKELLACNAKRQSDKWQNNSKPLRYEWMKEFYRIRGDFAHGNLGTQQPVTWNQLEHLVLATIAFPLIVRCCLQETGMYTLTDTDRAQIDCFEKFADTENFFKPPPDQQNSIDSIWKRYLNKRESEIGMDKILKDLEAKGINFEKLNNDP